jgi:hypothetical protein
MACRRRTEVLVPAAMLTTPSGSSHDGDLCDRDRPFRLAPADKAGDMRRPGFMSEPIHVDQQGLEPSPSYD